MARTISEIKKVMTDAFMADATLRERYGLSADATWGGSFSSVSLENILLYIVAACCWTVETLLDRHKSDVEELISRAVVASVPWYWKKCMAFQLGDSLELDTETQEYRYMKEDASKQVVKYAAVRDRGTAVEILVSGESGGRPSPLSSDVLTAFKQYMNMVKIAGVALNIRSLPADTVTLSATVWVDGLVIDGDGRSVSDGSYPVEEAIETYLKGIVYGGTFNKTKLVDAIQSVDGVEDVELGECKAKTSSGGTWTTVKVNNYTAVGGSINAEGLRNTLSYVVQD